MINSTVPYHKGFLIQRGKGIGDIFNSMFLKTYVKDNDPLWAAAMSIATTNKCNKKTGVNKININRNIEQIAHNIYQKSFRLH